MSRSSTVSTTPLLNIQRPNVLISTIDTAPFLLDDPSADQNSHSEPQHNKLGTINGCYVPCLLNIMGIVLFERLGWGIGHVGIFYVLLIYIFAETAAILTVLSLSAIATNGAMKGGGSYYMISRTLGQEFGGSVGILFYCAYCVNIAFCCSGCAEEIIKTWYGDDTNTWTLNLIFASSILFICGCIALLGANIFTKVNVLLFITVFTAIGLSVIAGFTRTEFRLPDYKENDYIHHTWSWSQLKANFVHTCPNCYTIQIVFGVLFSGVTGLMEGANLSGDLANPAKSIPIGTLSAIGTAIVVYLFMIFSFGGSFNDNTLRDVTTIPQNVSWGYFGYYLSICGVLISSSSSALGSLFGASRVLQAVARDKIFPSIFNTLGYGTIKGDEPILAVILTWIISQCLLFIGGINLIAPIATSFFCLSYGTVNLSCFLLCVSGVTNFRPKFKYYSKWTALIGLIMNIFIMFYVDFTFASITLFAAICIFIYLIYRNSNTRNDWGDVGQSVLFHQLRKYLLELNKKNMDKHSKLWRPHILLLVDNHELSLIDFCNNIKKGGLYIIGSVLNVQFLQSKHNHTNLLQMINSEWIAFVNRNEIKAFPQIAIAPNKEQQLLGYQNLLSLGGLGAMKTNTVVLPLCSLKEINSQSSRTSIITSENDPRKLSAYDMLSDTNNDIVFDSPKAMAHKEYMELLSTILSMQKNVILTHNFEHFNYNLIVSKPIQNHFNITPRDSPLRRNKRKKMTLPEENNKWIDVWLLVDRYSFEIDDLKEEGNNDAVFPMLMMQFAHILSINKIWKTNANIRILLLIQKHQYHGNGMKLMTEKQNKFNEMLEKLRLIEYINKIETVILPVNESYSFKHNEWFDSSGCTISEYLTSDTESVEVNETERKRYAMTYDDAVIMQQRIERYYAEINKIIQSNSDETYFTFIALPDFDTNDRKDLSTLYIQSLHVLTQNLPPTALVKCGQQIPVISVDI